MTTECQKKIFSMASHVAFRSISPCTWCIFLQKFNFIDFQGTKYIHILFTKKFKHCAFSVNR